MVLNKLMSNNAFSNVRALIACIGRKHADPEEADAIVRIASRKNGYDPQEAILGRSVEQWASAALDILQIKRYEGSDPIVKELIQELPGQSWVEDVAEQVFKNVA